MIKNKVLHFVMAAVLLLSTAFVQGGAAVNAKSSDQPQAPELKFPEEIVVKFRPHVDIPYADQVEDELKAKQDQSLSRAFSDVPQLQFNRLFQSLDDKSAAGLAKKADASVFTQYYTVSVPEGANIDELLKQLNSSALVEEAYVKPQPVAPPSITLAPNSTPVQPSDDPRFPLQGYAFDAPQGINSPYAWQYEGGDGKGITWVDVEQGWAFNHEDLVAHSIVMLPGSVNMTSFGHGAAVFGQVSAVDNTIGNLGLASKSKPYASSQYRTNNTYNTAEAILSATTVLTAGDVILLEVQTSYPTTPPLGYIPIEVYPAEFDAIQYAVSIGITVVEAAGNGSVDLDTFKNVNGKYVLNPNHPDFRDSGAILVGAASASYPHSRMYFSTYGNRIDVYGWGSWDVSTLDAVDANSTTGYTDTFAGTSSASPIITAAAISLQGIATAKFGTPYSPAEIRKLLKYAAYNTPSSAPSNDKIGHMPNLKNIIDNLPTPGNAPSDTAAPLAPTNLIATAVTKDYVSLSWNAATDDIALTGYEIFVDGSLIPIAWTSDTSTTLHNLSAGNRSITVKARDAANNLSAASSINVTVPSPSICVGIEWNASASYSTGNKASYNGNVYQAKWWTQNDRPDLKSGPNDVWALVGPC